LAIPGLCLNAAAVQGSAMTVRALLFAPLLMAVLASGAQQVGFTSGVWTGDANYDGDGKFRDCTMTAQSENGVLLGFVISKDFDWGLVLADDSLDFELGTTEAVLLRIDARDPIPAVAKVVDVHGIVIPLENSDPVLDALRQGKVLTITAETAKVSFKLTGTKDAIAALAACVTEHRETEKVKRLNGGRTTSRYRRA
jgi:invasion protein IalB